MSDEFYIGYEPEMPPSLAARIRVAARGLVAIALVLPAVLVYTEGRFSAGTFEIGRPRTFDGILVEAPYPALVSGGMAYWLVGEGKHGAADLVRGRDGQRVSLSGTLIQRDTDRMIEIGAVASVEAGEAGELAPIESRGIVEIEGEIVDSKCHLGVMKPAEGPTHRDCAVRCLLGRIPPMFVPHGRGDPGRLALVSELRRPFDGAEAWAGRRLMVRGEVLQRGRLVFLAVARADIRTLD